MNQGYNLKKLLKENGKTQLDLADELGVHRGNISKMVNKVNLDLKVLEATSKILDIPLEELKKKLDVAPGQTNYVARLEESLEDKMKIITLLEDQLALYKKLEKERERSSD